MEITVLKHWNFHFPQGEEAKDSTENDKTPSETDKATCVDAPLDPKEEKVIEVEKSTYSQTPEIAEEKKLNETEKIETCIEKKPEEDKPATEEESQTSEIPMEKKAEEKEVIDVQTPEKEEKLVTECQKSPEENKTEKWSAFCFLYYVWMPQRKEMRLKGVLFVNRIFYGICWVLFSVSFIVLFFSFLFILYFFFFFLL